MSAAEFSSFVSLGVEENPQGKFEVLRLEEET